MTIDLWLGCKKHLYVTLHATLHFVAYRSLWAVSMPGHIWKCQIWMQRLPSCHCLFSRVHGLTEKQFCTGSTPHKVAKVQMPCNLIPTLKKHHHNKGRKSTSVPVNLFIQESILGYQMLLWNYSAGNTHPGTGPIRLEKQMGEEGAYTPLAYLTAHRQAGFPYRFQ